MPRDFVETNSFNAVGAGQTATVDLPVGGVTYHALQLNYSTTNAGGATKANMEKEIKEIRLNVDGKVQRRFSAAELFAINAFNSRAVKNGLLTVFFSEPWRRGVVGEDSLAWGTADLQTFQVEVDIAAIARAPTLSAKAYVERVGREMGPIVKWRRHNIPAAATGVHNWTTAPRQDAYYRVHAFSSDIADVEVTVDQREVFSATRNQINALYEDLKLAPQAKIFHVAFDPTQRVSDALTMFVGDGANARPISELRFDFNMTAAKAFDVITETLGPRD